MLELFKSTGILSDDINSFIDFIGPQYKENRLITAKNKEKIYLVHENSDIEGNAGNNTKGDSNYRGRIYVLSTEGVIGLLQYESMKNPNILTISDMQCKDPAYYGIGIGSAIMKYLEDYALREGIILIKGTLSQYDIDNNRDRLMNFYSKHDFNIDFYHREVKKIIKNL